MNNRLLDDVKKYKMGASLIVGIGIMLIPVCVFADVIPVDPDAPFYYNQLTRCFGVDNDNPQSKLDVNGDMKVLNGLSIGTESSTDKLHIKNTNTYGVVYLPCMSFNNISSAGNPNQATGLGAITWKVDGTYDVANIEAVREIPTDGTKSSLYFRTNINNGTGIGLTGIKIDYNQNVSIPNGGLNVGSASGASVGQIKMSGDINIGNVNDTHGEYFSSGGGYNAAYNGLAIISNAKGINKQAQTNLPSWLIDLGGRAADGTTFKIGTSDSFRIARIAPSGNFYSTDALFTISNSGMILAKSASANISIENTTQYTDNLILDLTSGIGWGGNSGHISMKNGGGETARITYGMIDGNEQSGFLKFYTANNSGVLTQAICIDRNQKVGIGGVTNPQYTLTVSGNVAARNFITSQAVWYDKVFSPTYNLMPLNKLELYVQEHQHLPDVPEEKEVLKNGVNMSEFQGRLLQKVEELTLYVINVNKELRKENQELKDRLEHLEKALKTGEYQEK
ncbi:MAG TPA: hypothetical protein DCS13_03740 [Candidatus Margulisbacteria bacterium]|nr:MAG: hypothetical protein A2X43_03830 [Candidatus Margulisbacteria bacterium GWD2_39_127]HAR62555.1 hypothetical protein [Candidatus Margulisiibacteriota bacterium]